MNRKCLKWGAPLLAAFILAGCGGGGGGGGGGYFPPVSGGGGGGGAGDGGGGGGGGGDMPPALTSESFIAYLKGVVQTALDTVEPVSTAAFDPPPTSDTTEPIVVE
ncbi:MAG: hypothetical protein KKC85_16175 [Gammaproteobacteria bacterium]|nr:hypothetical protein [Gammaproteobacteria bacterium]MBU1441722.1 hypothetical protein [Gammaproteobacteria bacterium]MBU2287953.1 hypothetical protein [Gammaproteobacteria bacterium]